MTTAVVAAVEKPLIRDPRLGDVAEWFAEHRASFTEYAPDVQTEWYPKTLYWAKPGTGMYSIRYVIMGPVLMVWGDLDAAVYRWSSAINWKFLADCDLQYFAGKCQASPVGRTFEDYDRDVAWTDFKNALEQRAEEGYPAPDQHAVEEGRRAIMNGQDEWRDWMRTDGHRVFGPDWYEWVPNLGKRVAQTCLAHLLGIKMAVAQIAKATEGATS